MARHQHTLTYMCMTVTFVIQTLFSARNGLRRVVDDYLHDKMFSKYLTSSSSEQLGLLYGLTYGSMAAQLADTAHLAMVVSDGFLHSGGHG